MAVRILHGRLAGMDSRFPVCRRAISSYEMRPGLPPGAARHLLPRGEACPQARRGYEVGETEVLPVQGSVLVTVRCPVDGSVPVTVHDVAEVVIRSGSDVREFVRCPRCGTILQVTSDPEPGFVRWLDAAIRDASGSPAPQRSEPARLPSSAFCAYLEYFRRELDGVDTVEGMLGMMDLAERPRPRPSRRGRRT